METSLLAYKYTCLKSLEPVQVAAVYGLFSDAGDNLIHLHLESKYHLWKLG